MILVQKHTVKIQIGLGGREKNKIKSEFLIRTIVCIYPTVR